MNVADLIGRIRQGDVRALARAVSLVEDDAPSAREILSGCFPYTGSAVRIGITGSPGAGKSTLVDGLARRYRAQQSTVGVIAVDPTSPYTGGAILGDRIRIQAMHHRRRYQRNPTPHHRQRDFEQVNENISRTGS